MNPNQPLPSGMAVDWNVPIEVDDGTVLRADVFRPIRAGRYPVLITYGPYAKGLSFQRGYPGPWEKLVTGYPEATAGTSSRFANWETVDPERWVPSGYVVIRVDSRGSGMSPGVIDNFSSRETRDFYECIEWAAAQHWSNGKVGLLGISYYAMKQWQVAALRPPHLAAICPFEGASDLYRDAIRHGGILSTFWIRWFPHQVVPVQYGLGERGGRSAVTEEPISGHQTLTDPELAANRIDPRPVQLAHPFQDDWFDERNAQLEDIEVPLLSCGNWGGQGLHLRGNVEGYLRAGSPQKWLEMHGRQHWAEFYTDYGVALQRQFFDHFLKGEDNGWHQRAPITLQVRTVDGFRERGATEWPLAHTRWTTLYLDCATKTLTTDAPTTASSLFFRAGTETVDFVSAPFPSEVEFTGPLAAKLHVASSTTDADLFVTLRLFDHDNQEVLFVGAGEPHAPVTQGWLRASHRALDPEQSRPWRPVHPHRHADPVTPGVTYPLDVELWPTSIVVPAGYHLMLTVSGHDFEHERPGPHSTVYGVEQRGSSVYLHDDPDDRPAAVFGGTTTLHSGGDADTYLLLPQISAPETP